MSPPRLPPALRVALRDLLRRDIALMHDLEALAEREKLDLRLCGSAHGGLMTARVALTLLVDERAEPREEPQLEPKDWA